MSDRFVLHTSKSDIEHFFDASMERSDYFNTDYNIAPGSLQPIVLEENGERQIQKARWGLIPAGADDEREGNDNNIVPSEDILENDWLAECVNRRRCLVPANGFYKWKSSEKKQMPFYIRLLSNELAAFAGIYDLWSAPSGRKVYSFAVLTTRANNLIEPVDDRMPVFLHNESFDRWLNADSLTEDMHNNLLKEPIESTALAVNRVSEAVNDLTNNGPELIQPIPK